MGRAQSGGLLLGLDLDQHPHNITLFHDKVLDAIDLDLGAQPLAERDAVADPDVDGVSLPVSSRAAGSNGDDLALLRLLLGGVGNVFDGIVSLDDNAVVKRQKLIVISKTDRCGSDIPNPCVRCFAGPWKHKGVS